MRGALKSQQVGRQAKLPTGGCLRVVDKEPAPAAHGVSPFPWTWSVTVARGWAPGAGPAAPHLLRRLLPWGHQASVPGVGGARRAPAATLVRAPGSLVRARRPPAGPAHECEAGQAHVARGSEFKVVKSKCHCHRSSGSKRATTTSWEEARRRSAGQLGREQLSQAGKGTPAVQGGTTSQSVSQGYREREALGTQGFLRTRAESRRCPLAWRGAGADGREEGDRHPVVCRATGSTGSDGLCLVPPGKRFSK